jgi:hypothetical protein
MQAKDKTKVQVVGRDAHPGSGRPVGSKARVPTGHVNVVGLAEMLGLSPKSIAAIERRGDPMIPPRSPLAGSGARRRALWRIADVNANIDALAAAASASRQRRDTDAAAASAWTWQGDPAAASGVSPPASRQPGHPGRPRGTGKNAR